MLPGTRRSGGWRQVKDDHKNRGLDELWQSARALPKGPGSAFMIKQALPAIEKAERH